MNYGRAIRRSTLQLVTQQKNEDALNVIIDFQDLLGKRLGERTRCRSTQIVTYVSQNGS